MQGYLFSKPVPENEVLDKLNKKTEASTYIYGFDWKDEYSINIDKATQLDFSFTPIDTWLYELLDEYILKSQLTES